MTLLQNRFSVLIFNFSSDVKKSEGWWTDVEEMYTTKWYTASKLKIKIENLAMVICCNDIQ